MIYCVTIYYRKKNEKRFIGVDAKYFLVNIVDKKECIIPNVDMALLERMKVEGIYFYADKKDRFFSDTITITGGVHIPYDRNIQEIYFHTNKGILIPEPKDDSI